MHIIFAMTYITDYDCYSYILLLFMHMLRMHADFLLTTFSPVPHWSEINAVLMCANTINRPQEYSYNADLGKGTPYSSNSLASCKS
jgi:hypothetical protein